MGQIRYFAGLQTDGPKDTEASLVTTKKIANRAGSRHQKNHKLHPTRTTTANHGASINHYLRSQHHPIDQSPYTTLHLNQPWRHPAVHPPLPPAVARKKPKRSSKRLPPPVHPPAVNPKHHLPKSPNPKRL